MPSRVKGFAAADYEEYPSQQIRVVLELVLSTVAGELNFTLKDNCEDDIVDYHLLDEMERLVVAVSYTKRYDGKKRLGYTIYLNTCTTFCEVNYLSDFSFNFTAKMRRTFGNRSGYSAFVRNVTLKDVSDKPIVYTDLADAKSNDIDFWLL